MSFKEQCRNRATKVLSNSPIHHPQGIDVFATRNDTTGEIAMIVTFYHTADCDPVASSSFAIPYQCGLPFLALFQEQMASVPAQDLPPEVVQ